MLCELAKEALEQQYNARFFHTYIDEDCIGTVKGVARMVHRRLLELRVLMRTMVRLRHYVLCREP